MPYGYHGKILVVDLSSGRLRVDAHDEAWYRTYMGGSNFGLYYILKHMPVGADPLGPENILGFVAGILVGTGAMFAGRWMVVGKSPLTGGWGDSNCGGNFAPAIKQCGYDGIFISGISPRPVYLLVDGQSVHFLPAADLWGRDAVECEAILTARHGQKARAACIGTAGEKGSLIAGIVNGTPRPEGEEWITLITCGGRFVATQPNGLGEYLDRDVVVARRIQ